MRAAKHWELGPDDVIATIFTDSADMYRSRLIELNARCGNFEEIDAVKTQVGCLEKQDITNFKELTHPEKKAIHNLKYFTWVEQQGKTNGELCEQWEREYWLELWDEVFEFDRLIEKFNLSF